MHSIAFSFAFQIFIIKCWQKLNITLPPQLNSRYRPSHFEIKFKILANIFNIYFLTYIFNILNITYEI